MLATASADKTVRLWDTRSKEEVGKVATPGANINVAWHPDGRSIAVGISRIRFRYWMCGKWGEGGWCILFVVVVVRLQQAGAGAGAGEGLERNND